MKKLAIVGMVLVGSAAWASHTPVISPNASGNACFGQWRAATADGSVFSTRKGANADHNVLDKLACSH